MIENLTNPLRMSLRTQCDVIDIPVDIGNINSISQGLNELANQKATAGKYVCVANVHMLTVARENPLLKTVLEKAHLVIADGMPLVWTQKRKGFTQAQRVSGPDLMLDLCKLCAANNHSIFLLGTDEATLKELSAMLLEQFPKLKIAGYHAPARLPENPPLDEEIARKINASGASFLFVGLGCPKQEFWCSTFAPHLNPISIGVGAAFDFHSGKKKRPPLWVQHFGLEWCYRLLSEPGRLWKRYLISNTQFIYLSMIDLVKSKRP
ncbi:WecB/TagA/CpsF family glycosyltransferase [Polynucleobacter asymbioticus]|uniref:Glycosyl transferase, WecB/TagA/CpsF family n=1 Tax=Polynucleobacter asymbioticus (strain DSM 18221 / CIP 109841 / QLW-P1DMWA-1) TaxID=312153 RepID=A4SVL5_POLAQ|nr:WecB/TagA/CpsF family glycosyltransferase [Polynucleobacter asymbioticus]ABP33529.1 glycosyl transferase, WecB/TagA/CpsF family [Polynucleobacter asymbioticus QLW-P1DMWA-1]